MNILEQFSISKSGRLGDNEDKIVVGDNYVLLIDGTTSKQAQNNKLEQTSGSWIAHKIASVFPKLNLYHNPEQLLNELSTTIREDLSGSVYCEPKPSASIVYYNDIRKEIVRYGDIHVAINGDINYGKKAIDIDLSEKRAKIIAQALEQGMSITEIKNNDIGRQYILPMLSDMHKYANKVGKYGYPVINGDYVTSVHINIFQAHLGDMVIFSSDGYPTVMNTLDSSELKLHELLLRDPLCYTEYKSTKGIEGSNISYDDRSYIRFIV